MVEKRNLIVFENTFEDEVTISLLSQFTEYNIVKSNLFDYNEILLKITNRNTLFLLGDQVHFLEVINNNIIDLCKKKGIKKSYYLIVHNKKNFLVDDSRDCIFWVNRESLKYDGDLYIKLLFDKMEYNDRIVDYIEKSFNIIANNKIVEAQKDEIEKLYEDLELMSKIDFLTNVLNRKALFESLETERMRTLRDIWRIQKLKLTIDFEGKVKDETGFFNHLGHFSFMMIDIDYFKRINDEYGHLIGDKVLQKMGEIFIQRGIFRGNDVIARFGGEEFAVIMPETNSFDALVSAERLKNEVKAEMFNDEKGNSFGITISIGISEFNKEDTRADMIIERADKALYVAKDNGRDQIVIYEKHFIAETVR